MSVGIAIGRFLDLLDTGWEPLRDGDSNLVNSVWYLLYIVKARMSWGNPAVHDNEAHSGNLRMVAESLVHETMTFGESTFKINPSFCDELVLSSEVGELGILAVSAKTRLELVYIDLGRKRARQA